MDKKLDFLEQEVLKLTQRVNEMEAELHKERTKWHPWQPIGPSIVPEPHYAPFTIPEITPIKACSKCGLQFDGPMGYCCPQPNCPTGLGPIMC